MFKLILFFTITFVVFNESQGDTSLGKCTDIEPLQGFNMNRFLGTWYAIQTTEKATPCLSYYITQDTEQEGLHYKITEIEQHTTVWSSALHHEHNITGDLTVPDEKTPGRMALDLPLDIGTTTFTVFMTDYDNYAAIFTCKKYPLIHSWGAKILSRAHTLDMIFVDKIRTRLSSYNIDPFNLNIVPQSLCPKAGAKGSLVKTASNVVTGVKNTVYNVVDGVEGSVKSLISDPNLKNNASPKTIDVRLNDPTVNNSDGKIFGETVSKAANNFGEKVSDVINGFGEEATGIINNVKDGASKVEDKFQDLASNSRDFVDDLGDDISNAASDVKERINKQH